MYKGQVKKVPIGEDEYGCTIWEDEEGEVIFTTPPESVFIAADKEDCWGHMTERVGKGGETG